MLIIAWRFIIKSTWNLRANRMSVWLWRKPWWWCEWWWRRWWWGVKLIVSQSSPHANVCVHQILADSLLLLLLPVIDRTVNTQTVQYKIEFIVQCFFFLSRIYLLFLSTRLIDSFFSRHNTLMHTTTDTTQDTNNNRTERTKRHRHTNLPSSMHTNDH